MSELSATQIPKPHDAQAFERCSLTLWRCILGDETAYLYGRSGQSQHGIDILGCRGGKPNRLVGIQCKLKGKGTKLGEAEVRREVEKVLRSELPLSEYIIATTAPDDVKLQNLAARLSISASKRLGRDLKISVVGWDNLQNEIRCYPEALNAFDPSHTPHGDKILQRLDDIPADVTKNLTPILEPIRSELSALTGC